MGPRGLTVMERATEAVPVIDDPGPFPVIFHCRDLRPSVFSSQLLLILRWASHFGLDSASLTWRGQAMHKIANPV